MVSLSFWLVLNISLLKKFGSPPSFILLFLAVLKFPLDACLAIVFYFQVSPLWGIMHLLVLKLFNSFPCVEEVFRHGTDCFSLECFDLQLERTLFLECGRIWHLSRINTSPLTSEYWSGVTWRRYTTTTTLTIDRFITNDGIRASQPGTTLWCDGLF